MKRANFSKEQWAAIKTQQKIANRKRLYGLTQEKFDAMLEKQNHQCLICGKSLLSRLVVDHDHACCAGEITCGKCVRGILCNACNRLLGMAHDSIEVLNNAIQYLKGYQK